MHPDVLWFVLALVLAGVYLSWTAGRLDRLHARVDSSRAALDAQLVRRSAVAMELATSGLLDPASALLIADAAHAARQAEGDDRPPAESDLSRALRAALDQPEQLEELTSTGDGRQLVDELEAAARRVGMARRFHNDAVAAARALRAKRHVRYLRLAGHAPPPLTFECDDAPPECLARVL
ncbi:membrane protein [Sporichthya brevicatena]|uniref:Membrane protein n=1 Tax=Sporichthya brevicatena TaxID=171442 RepID=A0ABP3S442_9ACTN